MTNTIQKLKKYFGASTVNAICSISVVIIILTFIWSLWAGKIDNVVMFGSGAFAALFISALVKTINTPV